MKIYEKPMAIVNRFNVEDVIAASELPNTTLTAAEQAAVTAAGADQGVVFQW